MVFFGSDSTRRDIRHAAGILDPILLFAIVGDNTLSRPTCN